jgi:hypothetical protein
MKGCFSNLVMPPCEKVVSRSILRPQHCLPERPLQDGPVSLDIMESTSTYLQ